MTIIVATRTAVYADSRLNWEGYGIAVQKVFRAPCGSIYATAGGGRMTEQFERFARLGDFTPDFPDVEEDFAAVVLSKEGLFIFDSAFARYPVAQEWVAIGSAGETATRALLRGSTPEQALEEVFSAHSDCAGPIQMMTLEVPHAPTTTNRRAARRGTKPV